MLLVHLIKYESRYWSANGLRVVPQDGQPTIHTVHAAHYERPSRNGHTQHTILRDWYDIGPYSHEYRRGEIK